MEVKMKNKNVLLKELKEEQMSANGIIIPVGKYNRKAKVIESNSIEIKPGDIVLKTIGNGTVFIIDGEEYEVLHESHILAIIE